jgi:hypothetical protein
MVSVGPFRIGEFSTASESLFGVLPRRARQLSRAIWGGKLPGFGSARRHFGRNVASVYPMRPPSRVKNRNSLIARWFSSPTLSC